MNNIYFLYYLILFRVSSSNMVAINNSTFTKIEPTLENRLSDIVNKLNITSTMLDEISKRLDDIV